MNGTMLVIQTNGEIIETQHDRVPDTTVIHEALGGYLELVPYFTTIDLHGRVYRCVAFCNEHGKMNNLPDNERANIIWQVAQIRLNLYTDDHLVGPIVVLFGDREFMAEI
jgi:hypothetical protein